MLKERIASVLPEPFMRFQDEIRGRFALYRSDKRNFTSEKLMHLNDLDVSSYYTDTSIEDAWKEDSARIGSIFGRGEYNLAVSPSCRRHIYYMTMGLKPGRVLEIGTNVGGSTLYFASALKRLNDKFAITTVDIIDVNSDHGPWKNFGLDQSPAMFAEKLGLKNITFSMNDSLRYLNNCSQKFDLIFLDGDHSASGVYNEISAALKLLNKDGIILLHDYYPNGKRLRANRGVIGGPYHAVERIKRESPGMDVFPLGSIARNGIYSEPSSLAVLGRAA